MTINHGDSIDDIGTNLDFQVKDEISVTAKNYTEEVLTLYSTTDPATSPTNNDDRFKVNDNLPLLGETSRTKQTSQSLSISSL